MISDCGGVADVLEYIIVTGIIFTGKDKSETLSLHPCYSHLPYITFVASVIFHHDLAYLMRLLKVRLTVLVNVFQPS